MPAHKICHILQYCSCTCLPVSFQNASMLEFIYMTSTLSHLKNKTFALLLLKILPPWTCSTEPLGNIETQNCQKHRTQVQTHIYWNSICISVRFPDDFICTLNLVKQVLVFTVEYRELQRALLPPLQRNNVKLNSNL